MLPAQVHLFYAATTINSIFCKGGVQWKQGVVICMVLCTSLLYNTTPHPLHPPPTAPPFDEYPLILMRMRIMMMIIIILIIIIQRYCNNNHNSSLPLHLLGPVSQGEFSHARNHKSESPLELATESVGRFQ